MTEVPIAAILEESSRKLQRLAADCQTLAQGTVSWAGCCASIQQLLYKKSSPANVQRMFMEYMRHVFTLVFDHNSGGYRAKRFSALRSLLLHKLLPKRIAESISAPAASIDLIVQQALSEQF